MNKNTNNKKTSSVVLNNGSIGSVVNEDSSNDFYSYRRVRDKFDRVRSIGVLGVSS